MEHPSPTLTVDLGAVARNTQRILAAASGARLFAVVKANAYGLGAVDVARAALAGGASMLVGAVPLSTGSTGATASSTGLTSTGLSSADVVFSTVGAALAEPLTRSFWPTRILFASVMPLSAISSAVFIPCLWAMTLSESPATTE